MGLSRKLSAALTYNAVKVLISIPLSIIYSIVVVRWLQIQEFGGYGFLDGIFSILGVIYVLGTHAPITRFVPELVAKKDYARLRRLISILQKINLLGSSIATLSILIGADILFEALRRPELAFYARVMALGIIPLAMTGIMRNILNAVYEQKFLAILDISFDKLLRFAFLILFVIILNLGLVGTLMIYISSSLIATVVLLIRLWRKHSYLFKGEQRSLGSDYAWRIIRYTAPLSALGLTGSFLSYTSNILLGVLRDLKDVAYFDISKSFVNTVFSEIWLVIGSVGIVSLSEVNASSPNKLSLVIEQYVKLISLYVFPVAIGGIILAEPILVTLYGEKVLPSVPILRILLLGYCFLNIFGISGTILNVKEKTYALLFGSVLDWVMLVTLNLWLIPILGVLGAAISQIVSSLIRITYYMYLLMIKIRMQNFIPLKKLGKYLSASLFMGAAVWMPTHFLKTGALFQLVSGLAIGILIYAIALRLIGAFDQTDKHIIMNSKIPFKSVILKLLWKD